jgi:hypothetical protein
MLQLATKYTKWHKIYQMDIKSTNNFHCKTLQNLPQIGIFGLETNHLATLVKMLTVKMTIFTMLTC